MTNNKYPAGTVAIATVMGVKNVKVFRRYIPETGLYDWAFTPEPKLGLNYSCVSDHENAVIDIEVIDTPETKPERAPYDVSKMTAKQLEKALIEVLGEGEEEGHEYYDDATGINAFYHILAETGGYGDPGLPEDVVTTKVLGKVSIIVPSLGQFVSVDQHTDFMAESGDADSTVVFKIGDRHFRKQGYLDSYEGGVWDGRLEEVRPVEKTITVWEAK